MSSMDNARENLAQDDKQQRVTGEDVPVNDSYAHDMKDTLGSPYYNKPAIHPNFDPNQTPLDPNRPLTDIPSPVRRGKNKLGRIYDMTTVEANDNKTARSAWDLLVSPSFASHLELLQVGRLIELPSSFTKAPNNAVNYPLLAPLSELSLIDIGDIYQAQQQIKQQGCILTRYGAQAFNEKYNTSSNVQQDNVIDHRTSESITDNQLTSTQSAQLNQKRRKNSAALYTDLPEMINDGFAPDWELILHPEHFDNGVDSLETDILACSVAVHVLKQCQTRKTVNRNITAKQLCQHMRSYVLSQCRLYPHKSERYRQMRLFEGHVLVAAKYLGLKMSFVEMDSRCAELNEADYHVYLNVSSRNSLLVRYPNISDYFINGWQ